MIQSLLTDGLLFGGIVALLGLGFSLQFQANRFFSFSFALSVVLAPYAALLLLNQGMSLSLALPAGLLASAVFELLFSKCLTRPLRSAGRSSAELMLASIAMYMIVVNVLSIVFADDVRVLRTWELSPVIEIAEGRYSIVRLWSLAISFAACLFLGVLLRVSSWGIQLRAISDSWSLAEAIGIDIETVRAMSAAIAGGCAGLAGILIGLDQDLVPTMGFEAFVLAILCAFLGGLHSVPLLVVSGLGVGVAQRLVTLVVPIRWVESLIFVGFLVVILLWGRHE